MIHDNLLHISQSQAEAFHIVQITCMHAIKLLEYLFQILLLDADAVILDGNHQFARLIPSLHRQLQIRIRVILPNANEKMNWMPNSNKLYYTVMGEEQNDLVVFDPATMREEVLLKNVPEGYFSWSPTEDYLIYMLTDEGEKVSGPLKRLLHPRLSS